MGKRREPRKPVHLTVRILGTDASEHPFVEKVDALDASRCGLRVRGLSVTLKLEDIISVSYKDQKARYRVKWIGESPSPAGGPPLREAGLENIAPERKIFDFELPIPVLDNYAGKSAEERRTFPRMRCVASAELRREGDGLALYSREASGEKLRQNAPIMVGITDLSLGGCFIDMPMPLAKGTRVEVILWLNAVKIQTSAVVSNVRPGFGMGLQFIDLPVEEQARLREYIATIPRYPFQTPR